MTELKTRREEAVKVARVMFEKGILVAPSSSGLSEFVDGLACYQLAKR
jgi:hypothetical protein